MNGGIMYIRFNLEKNGRIYLQQLLSLDKNNGKPEPVWENVPLTGSGSFQSIDFPTGMSCGLFVIEEIINKAENHLKKYHLISALSIRNISEIDNSKTRLDTLNNKEFFVVNVNHIDFIKIVVNALTKFQIITIDSDGNVTNL
jgi:hypothetical protein